MAICHLIIQHKLEGKWFEVKELLPGAEFKWASHLGCENQFPKVRIRKGAESSLNGTPFPFKQVLWMIPHFFFWVNLSLKAKILHCYGIYSCKQIYSWKMFHLSMTGVCFVSVEVKLSVFFADDTHVWLECVEIWGVPLRFGPRTHIYQSTPGRHHHHPHHPCNV